MINLEGAICRLRAVEPADVDLLYAWENDPAVWGVSGTTAPYSRECLERFVEQQRFDIWQTRQMRLMIEPLCGCEARERRGAQSGTAAGAETVERSVLAPVGALDLFEFEPQHRRAGVGILIHDVNQRGRGWASDALAVAERYAREVLGLHQLWCEVGVENMPSLALFRGAGFETVGVRRDWIWTPQGYRDAVVMQKVFLEQ